MKIAEKIISCCTVRYESDCRPANFKMVSILKKTGTEQENQIWKFNEASR